jgi:hypothetical protein
MTRKPGALARTENGPPPSATGRGKRLPGVTRPGFRPTTEHGTLALEPVDPQIGSQA